MIIPCPWRYALLACQLLMCAASCSSSDAPSPYSAVITTVYGEQVPVSHFYLRYWWQERGETPFLQEESLQAQEVIFEVMTPLHGDPSRVQVETKRISFDRIGSMSFEITTTGKIMTIVARDGLKHQAALGFPKQLKKDPSAGIADGKIYACGFTMLKDRLTEYQLELDFIRTIQLTDKAAP